MFQGTYYVVFYSVSQLSQRIRAAQRINCHSSYCQTIRNRNLLVSFVAKHTFAWTHVCAPAQEFISKRTLCILKILGKMNVEDFIDVNSNCSWGKYVVNGCFASGVIVCFLENAIWNESKSELSVETEYFLNCPALAKIYFILHFWYNWWKKRENAIFEWG